MKKGFTLIELLAVIVILAIIAIIATPIVLNIIDETKSNATLRSVDFYLDAVDYAISNRVLDNKNIEDGKYNILENGNICLEYEDGKCVDELAVELEGEVPQKGNIIIMSGKIDSISVSYNDEQIDKYGNGELISATYEPGYPIYFNVDTGEVCEEKDSNSQTETKSGCMKFYVIKDLGNALDLILDHNTTATIEWTDSTTITNQSGPKNLLTQLYNDTKNWNGVLTPLDFTMDQRGQVSNAYFTVEYSKIPAIEGATTPYKARIISSQEISKIVGFDSWNDKTSPGFYYFDSLKNTASSTCKSGDISGCKYGWLYDRTSKNCTKYGCLNNSNISISGYWTITPVATVANKVRYVYFSGRFAHDKNVNENAMGVRPVITILKSNLEN